MNEARVAPAPTLHNHGVCLLPPEMPLLVHTCSMPQAPSARTGDTERCGPSVSRGEIA